MAATQKRRNSFTDRVESIGQFSESIVSGGGGGSGSILGGDPPTSDIVISGGFPDTDYGSNSEISGGSP